MSRITVIRRMFRSQAVYWAGVIGCLTILAVLVFPGYSITRTQAAPATESFELVRDVKDVYGTHNVVYINFDATNNRFRAHCVSAGNENVTKYIKSCRLYEQSTGQYSAGEKAGPSKVNIRTRTGLMAATTGSCYYAEMWIAFPGTNDTGFSLKTDCR